MSPDPWISTVTCGHRGVLGRASTVAAWTDAACCAEATTADGWRVGVEADDPSVVHRSVAALRRLNLPVGPALARLSRQRLPSCSILLSDGDGLAALAWGRPLGLVEIDRWEYAMTSEPPAGAPWAAVSPGTLIDLADCGPTVFHLPYPDDLQESA